MSSLSDLESDYSSTNSSTLSPYSGLMKRNADSVLLKDAIIFLEQGIVDGDTEVISVAVEQLGNSSFTAEEYGEDQKEKVTKLLSKVISADGNWVSPSIVFQCASSLQEYDSQLVFYAVQCIQSRSIGSFVIENAAEYILHAISIQQYPTTTTIKLLQELLAGVSMLLNSTESDANMVLASVHILTAVEYLIFDDELSCLYATGVIEKGYVNPLLISGLDCFMRNGEVVVSLCNLHSMVLEDPSFHEVVQLSSIRFTDHLLSLLRIAPHITATSGLKRNGSSVFCSRKFTARPSFFRRHKTLSKLPSSNEVPRAGHRSSVSTINSRNSDCPFAAVLLLLDSSFIAGIKLCCVPDKSNHRKHISSLKWYLETHNSSQTMVSLVCRILQHLMTCAYLESDCLFEIVLEICNCIEHSSGAVGAQVAASALSALHSITQRLPKEKDYKKTLEKGWIEIHHKTRGSVTTALGKLISDPYCVHNSSVIASALQGLQFLSSVLSVNKDVNLLEQIKECASSCGVPVSRDKGAFLGSCRLLSLNVLYSLNQVESVTFACGLLENDKNAFPEASLLFLTDVLPGSGGEVKVIVKKSLSVLSKLTTHSNELISQTSKTICGLLSARNSIAIFDQKKMVSEGTQTTELDVLFNKQLFGISVDKNTDHFTINENLSSPENFIDFVRHYLQVNSSNCTQLKESIKDLITTGNSIDKNTDHFTINESLSSPENFIDFVRHYLQVNSSNCSQLKESIKGLIMPDNSTDTDQIKYQLQELQRTIKNRSDDKTVESKMVSLVREFTASLESKVESEILIFQKINQLGELIRQRPSYESKKVVVGLMDIVKVIDGGDSFCIDHKKRSIELEKYISSLEQNKLLLDDKVLDFKKLIQLKNNENKRLIIQNEEMSIQLDTQTKKIEQKQQQIIHQESLISAASLKTETLQRRLRSCTETSHSMESLLQLNSDANYTARLKSRLHAALSLISKDVVAKGIRGSNLSPRQVCIRGNSSGGVTLSDLREIKHKGCFHS